MNMKYAMRSEDTEQINVVSWANWNENRYPELRWLFHVPNGGSRNKQITHRKWKELNLMSPLKPDETPDFRFQELQMKLYYTIYL